MHHRLISLVLAGSSVLVVAACGSDDAVDGIASQEEWCAVVGEVDDELASADPEVDFAAAKSASQRVNDDVQRLIASVDLVDEAARDDVAVLLKFVGDFTAAIAAAPDEEAANAALGPIFEALPEDGSAASQAWILETCGIDIGD